MSNEECVIYIFTFFTLAYYAIICVEFPDLMRRDPVWLVIVKLWGTVPVVVLSYMLWYQLFKLIF